jgi:hypothetical protein
VGALQRNLSLLDASAADVQLRSRIPLYPARRDMLDSMGLRFGLTRSGLVGDVFGGQAERMPGRVGVDAPVIVGLEVVPGRACRQHPSLGRI